MTVGDRIRMKREELGISQTELAEKIRVSKQTLYKYEKNIITNIPSDKIMKISEVLGVSEAYLMGWNFSKEEPNITARILSDSVLMEHIKKLLCLNAEHRQFIYDSTAYWYKKEGH